MTDTTKPIFNILGIYVKDFSFESPNPHIAFSKDDLMQKLILSQHIRLEENIIPVR